MRPLEERITCLNMLEQGYAVRYIYDSYYSKLHPDTKYKSFQETLASWKKKSKSLADVTTLYNGTYPEFTAHGATVQVNRSGEVVQAWIKQHTQEFDVKELVEVIKENTTPVLISPNIDTVKYRESMLEIPLYDMHFPLATYEETLSDLIELLYIHQYEEINLVIGQDLFHNDDFRGRTTSGRPIEKLDMIQAWKSAESFWYNLIYHAMFQSKKVNLIYSKGNHDETLAWAFVQRLAAIFPELYVDDSMKQRKCIYWKGCFIGLSHGHTKKSSKVHDIRGQFTVEYPQEFSMASVREIHVGHLHHEEAKDSYGVTVRRLSTSVPTDEWSEDEGYVGAHKRFMIFEYVPDKLSSIHFI